MMTMTPRQKLGVGLIAVSMVAMVIIAITEIRSPDTWVEKSDEGSRQGRIGPVRFTSSDQTVVIHTHFSLPLLLVVVVGLAGLGFAVWPPRKPTGQA
jgi:hypothetical protein